MCEAAKDASCKLLASWELRRLLDADPLELSVEERQGLHDAAKTSRCNGRMCTPCECQLLRTLDQRGLVAVKHSRRRYNPVGHVPGSVAVYVPPGNPSISVMPENQQRRVMSC